MSQTNHPAAPKPKPGVSPTLARPGGLSYLEIPALDARRSALFYEEILGWNVHGIDTPQPKFEDLTGHLIGRWVTGRAISREPGLFLYFYVDHIHDIVKRVPTHGGEIIKAPYPEADLWVATLRDPAGNTLGLWQARDSAQEL